MNDYITILSSSNIYICLPGGVTILFVGVGNGLQSPPVDTLGASFWGGDTRGISFWDTTLGGVGVALKEGERVRITV
jgi:hypothetical protein